MKSKILGILIALIFAAGYVTLNYPVLGTLYNPIREGKVMDSYDHAVHTMDKGKRIKNKKNLQKVLCLVNQGMFFCCGDFYEREEEKVQA